tara:strand:- start:335 stop:754 length:420 start_codon:yes stop_codon:yes gene_type:complete
MTSKKDRRIQKREDAADFLNAHSGFVMEQLVDVVSDLSDEVDGLNHFEQDAAFAAELAHRIDKAINFPDPIIEALDGVISFFVALAALGIYRSVARKEKLRGKRLDKLRAKLQEKGPKMAKAARFRLKRRIARIEAKVK